MTQTVIPSNDIRVACDTGFLGSGSYAKVKLAVWRGALVAVKELHDIFFEAGGCSEWESSFVQAFMNECNMLAGLRHPNVVQFLGVAVPSRGPPLLVTELMRESLQDHLRRSPALQTREIITISHDIANALDYIHGLEKPIAHRDLAPKNILLEYKPEIRAKVADLGVAKVMGDVESVNTRRPGTECYMPPEAFFNGQYTLKIDVFSLGVIMLQMVVGREPTPSPLWRPCGDGTFRLVPEEERRQIDLKDVGLDHPLRSLILQCLEIERPSSHEIATAIRDIVANFDQNESKGYAYVPEYKIRELESANKETVAKIEKQCQDTVEACHSSLTAVISKLKSENESLQREKESILRAAEQTQISLNKMTASCLEETERLSDALATKTKEMDALSKQQDDLKQELEIEQDQKRRSEQQLQTDFSLRLETALIKAKVDKERELAQMREELEGNCKTKLESLMTENEAAFARTQQLYEKERAEDQDKTSVLMSAISKLKSELQTLKEENADLRVKLDDATSNPESDYLKKQQDLNYKAAMYLVRNQQRSAIKAAKREFEAQKKKLADDFQEKVSSLCHEHREREGELKMKLEVAEQKTSSLEGLVNKLRQQLTWPVRV
jgi:serine/threonine protein kinase